MGKLQKKLINRDKLFTATRIGGSSCKCHCKCPPMWDLQWEKNCRRKIFYYVCSLYFHNLHHCWLFKIN